MMIIKNKMVTERAFTAFDMRGTALTAIHLDVLSGMM